MKYSNGRAEGNQVYTKQDIETRYHVVSERGRERQRQRLLNGIQVPQSLYRTSALGSPRFPEAQFCALCIDLPLCVTV